MNINVQKNKNKADEIFGRNRNYAEIVDYLTSCKQIDYSESAILRIKELDKHLGNISEKIDIILVGGANDKSLTVNFAAKLLAEEGFKAGTVYSTHLLTYNEQISLDSKPIQNKQLTDFVNEVLIVCETNKINATAFEIITMASLLYFKSEDINIVIIEVGMGGRLDATNAFNPKITAVTQIASDNMDLLGDSFEKITYEIMGLAKKDCLFISAEQSKNCLQKMKDLAEVNGAKWIMPIRKQSPLPYIFEQLYGRIASLAERIALLYIETIKGKFSPFLKGNLLLNGQGQRGRPTLELKKNSMLNPVKTLKSFWNEKFELLRGNFELLDKEKPTILLDNAQNLQAIANTFLGIRLLHYKKTLNGFALIMGIKNYHDVNEVIKLVRYLLKKVSGQVFFIPIPNDATCHKPEDLCKLAKSFGIRASAHKSLNEAFELAKQTVDERQGLVAITGSTGIISEYWKNKDIKKFS